MSKRFTDTQLWEKAWFMRLKPKHKCLWNFLKDRCDQSGVWEPNWELASIYIGEPITVKDLYELGGHVELLKNGKVYIPDFINFQYGRISENSPAHKPVFRAIEKNNLSDRVFNRVSNTLQEKEKDKEEEMEEEIVSKEQIEKLIFSDEQFIDELKRLNKGKDLRRGWDQCWVHFSNLPNPLPVWAWRQKFSSWMTNMKIDPKGPKTGLVQ